MLQFDFNFKLIFRVEKEEATLPTDPKPAVSKSGRKIRGRGTIVSSPQLRSEIANIMYMQLFKFLDFFLISLSHRDGFCKTCLSSLTLMQN